MSVPVSAGDVGGFSDLDFEWSGAQSDWMSALARHYEELQNRWPGERLIVVFDIDGTILDMRHLVRWVLLAYDRAHGTEHFRGLQAELIHVHENQVERFLQDWPLPDKEAARVLSFYRENAWSDEAILASHQPYRGVLDVIRWFQIQPSTEVGLNTGRPENMRDVTLESLNRLGAEYRVRFRSHLLHMPPAASLDGIPAAKVDGLNYFRKLGYRVAAVVDNEPENIEAMARADRDGDILFLHADTIFESKQSGTPRAIHGRFYDITNLVSRERLPRRVQFVWHAVNTRSALERFLTSGIEWGEVDVRRDPWGRIVVRRESFEQTPWAKAETLLLLEDCLREFQRNGRSIKLDLKEGEIFGQVEELAARAGFDDARLWFNAPAHVLGEQGFRRLAASHPRAVIQCPVDFLTPLILSMPGKARDILAALSAWGITRFSLSWQGEDVRFAIKQIEAWGWQVNVYDVPNLEAFLQAALLLPRSLTSNFNFSKWSW